MLNSENTIKKCHGIIIVNYALFYQRKLPYKLIVGSYDKIQHVMILNLDLVQLYSKMCYYKNQHTKMECKYWLK